MLRRLSRSLTTVLLGSLLACAGCGDEETDGLAPLQIPNDPDCDPLVPEVCAMPFPSSRWLTPDDSRATGFRLELGPTTLPRNDQGVHVDPAPYARLDGFGVGVPALAFFPNLDASNLPDETRIAETLEADSPVLMFAVGDGGLTRIPCFAELDAAGANDETRALYIRPAVLLEEGTRYVVALRGLVRKDGSPVPPSDAFVALRDQRATGTPVADRVAHFEELFGLLAGAGVAREELTLTWDWVTASHEALHGPLLHMRDQAFAELGTASPAFTVTSIENFTEEQNAHIAFEVQGTFDVPDYMVQTMLGTNVAYLLDWGDDGLPRSSGVYKAHFRARVPRGAASGEPHGVILHGHGLNGSDGQIGSSFFDEIAQEEKLVIVGCDMIGMSHEDVSVIIKLLNDMSDFPVLADRLHQGVLDHLFLARGMKLGFDEIPEIAATGLVIDPAAIYYNGISQGGIFGATHVAMSQDILRGHLGVPGNNYSTLLPRSVDFGPFFLLLSLFYPDARDQALLLATIQSLWDRTDPVSHYRHLAESPHENTPKHEVLLASATADWQVALLTNEVVARSDIGIALLPDYGKDIPLVEPVSYPHQGSGLVNYSFGNPWPAPGNVPPYDEVGDPHGSPRTLGWHNQQMLHFYRTGEIIDVCGGDGCTPD